MTPAEVAAEPLLVFCQRDYPEYWDIITGWLREHRLRPQIAGEYDGVDSLMAAVESGLGVAVVTTRTADRVPKRVQLRTLASAPDPLCIAAGHRRTERATSRWRCSSKNCARRPQPSRKPPVFSRQTALRAFSTTGHLAEAARARARADVPPVTVGLRRVLGIPLAMELLYMYRNAYGGLITNQASPSHRCDMPTCGGHHWRR